MLKLFAKYSLGSVLSAFISLFSTPIITALIIPEELGKASMYTLAFNLILQIVMLGTDQSYVRDFYKHSDAKGKRALFVNCLVPSLVCSLIAFFIIYLFRAPISNLMLGEISHLIVILLGISVFVGVFERFVMLLLRLEKRAILFSFLRFFSAGINFAIIYLYATHIKKDFYAIVYGNILAIMITVLLAIFATGSEWHFRTIHWSKIRPLIRYGLPFVPAFLASWIFEGVDKIVLRDFSSFEELGLFSAAFKFVAILSILQLAFTTFWAPMAMELYESDSITARQKFKNVFSIASALLFIGGLGLITSTDIIMLLFDKQYDKSAQIMPFLLFIPIMYTLSEVTVGGINFKNKTYWHLIIAIVSGVINSVLCYILIPKYGAKGASMSTGLSYIMFFSLRTIISIKYYPFEISKVKLTCAIMLFMAICWMNTFLIFEKRVLMCINIAGIFVTAALYFKEIKHIFRESRKNKIDLQEIV